MALKTCPGKWRRKLIREYRNGDIEEILDIWFKASSLAHPFLEADFLEKEKFNVREIYIPNTETWVYAEGDFLLGFISMIGNEVGALFVRPEFQGLGIGTGLVDHVAPLHEELEVEVFDKNTIGRSFYDKYGFELLEMHTHEETGFDLLRMKFRK